jgi:hypothetical protein
MSVVVTSRITGIAVVRGLIALGVGLAALWAALIGSAGLAVAGPSVPYSDPAASGSLGLCNQQGQQVTSGSISTVPFVWRAVSTAPATGAYAGTSRTAILMAYQPIQGLAANDWSGDQLTASSRYSNAASPMAAATGGDESLAQFMNEFKPQWDGFLQLRLYLGAANEQAYNVHYPTLDIQVTGNTWQAVDGATVNCNAGTAESIESILLPAKDLTPSGGASSSTGSSTPAASAGSSTAPAAAGSGSSGHRDAGASAPGATATQQKPPSSSSSDGWIAAAIAVVLIALLFAVGLPRVRRRRASRAGDVAKADADASAPETGKPAANEAPLLAVSSTKGTNQ